jgi:hypothetical protein
MLRERIALAARPHRVLLKHSPGGRTADAVERCVRQLCGVSPSGQGLAAPIRMRLTYRYRIKDKHAKRLVSARLSVRGLACGAGRTNLRCALFLSINRTLSRALAHPLFQALFGAPQVMLFEQIGTRLPY